MKSNPARNYTMSEEERDWRAESDLRTLIDAAKIRKDAKRLKAAMVVARKQKEALMDITNHPKPKE